MPYIVQSTSVNNAGTLMLALAGKSAYAMKTLKCSLVKSIHIVVDTAMRNICDEFWNISKLLIT